MVDNETTSRLPPASSRYKECKSVCQSACSSKESLLDAAVLKNSACSMLMDLFLCTS